jgi:type I restriction enzyme S subunit
MTKQPTVAIPSSWEWSTIGEVVQERVQQSGPRTSDSFLYVDISSIDTSIKKIVEPKTIPTAEAPSRARQNIQPHDVLVSMTRPNLNAVAIVPEGFHAAISSTGFDVLRAHKIEPRWLFYLVQTSAFVESMSTLVQGALYPAIRPRDVRGFRIPIAPIKEQRRIVAEIEKEFTRLEAAMAALQRVRANLKRYRAAILKASFEGRLVTTEAELARRENRPYEPAAALLQRILAEHRSYWEDDQLAKFKALRVVPKDTSWKTKYPRPVAPDTKEVGNAPEGWVWASPDQIASPEDYSLAIGPFGSNLKVSDYKDSGIPLVFVRNIRTHNYVNDLKYVSPEKAEELRPHWVAGGDILITKMGDPPGDSSIYPKHLPTAIITADCIKFRLTSQIPFAEFFVYAIRSDLVHSQILSITKGVAQLKVSLSRFRSIALPLPPLKEQERITEVLEREFATIAKLDNEITTALLRASRLRQAILNSAFIGKLVPQDPSDEPAEKLLDMIRANRQSPKHDSALTESHLAPAREEDMPSNNQSTKRDLVETLRGSDKGLPPEDLFSKAGYDRETIDDFYAALKKEVLAGRIRELRPNKNTVKIQVVSR